MWTDSDRGKPSVSWAVIPRWVLRDGIGFTPVEAR